MQTPIGTFLLQIYQVEEGLEIVDFKKKIKEICKHFLHNFYQHKYHQTKIPWILACSNFCSFNLTLSIRM